jgi:hypothetical protein
VRLYPDIPARRAATVASDALVLVLLLLFAWLGVKVHDTVNELAALGEGVHGAGSSIQSGFDAAADAVGGVPLVGGKIAGGLRDAGQGTGGNVAELGTSGENGVHRLANLLGVLTFLLPSVLVLMGALPRRVALVRRLTDAAQVLREPQSVERRRLVAMRAAFGLPYGQLLAHTRDPLGDLAAERYEPLVAAALEDAGLRPR